MQEKRENTKACVNRRNAWGQFIAIQSGEDICRRFIFGNCNVRSCIRVHCCLLCRSGHRALGVCAQARRLSTTWKVHAGYAPMSFIQQTPPEHHVKDIRQMSEDVYPVLIVREGTSPAPRRQNRSCTLRGTFLGDQTPGSRKDQEQNGHQRDLSAFHRRSFYYQDTD